MDDIDFAGLRQLLLFDDSASNWEPVPRILPAPERREKPVWSPPPRPAYHWNTPPKTKAKPKKRKKGRKLPPKPHVGERVEDRRAMYQALPRGVPVALHGGLGPWPRPGGGSWAKEQMTVPWEVPAPPKPERPRPIPIKPSLPTRQRGESPLSGFRRSV